MTNTLYTRPRLKILILEFEYLVALDAERILSEAFPCDIMIGRPDQGPILGGTESYDVALLDAGPSLVHSARIARELCQAGMSVVFSSVGKTRSKIRSHQTVTIVSKPYDEQALIEAILSKLG